MDPVTAFQLAASVVTFVEFSRSLLNETLRIYHSGSIPSQHGEAVADDSAYLSSLASQIMTRLKEVGKGTALLGDMDSSFQNLSAVCEECIAIQQELEAALAKVRQGISVKLGERAPQRLARSLVAALKQHWSRDKIAALSGRLSRVKDQMLMALLVYTWHGISDKQSVRRPANNPISEQTVAARHQGLSLARQLERLSDPENSAKLDPGARDVAIDLKRLRNGTSAEDEADRNRLLGSIDDYSISISDLVLQSLDSGPWNRENQISTAYEHTFEWVLEDQPIGDSAGQQLRSNQHETNRSTDQADPPEIPESRPSVFREWLSRDDGEIFWITGKPGSGKSTLMKFLVESGKLRENLMEWAKPHPLVLASFYFWYAGSENDKSSRGLLIRLLHQCLCQCRQLIPEVISTQWKLDNIFGLKTRDNIWTWEDLYETFKKFLLYNGKEFRLALFIDGLDEFDDVSTRIVDGKNAKRTIENLSTLVDFTKELAYNN
ncbi:hypothetical protein DL765_010853 [Monosporascus sp. GIB2]|nr:hypothetical protein DL765_010853 [Monosporascus sp. GIB2]